MRSCIPSVTMGIRAVQRFMADHRRERDTPSRGRVDDGGPSIGHDDAEALTLEECVPTGIDALDRKLGGGIPDGSVVLFSASPASQSELLLYEFLADRDALYITTERSESTVRSALTEMEAMHPGIAIRHVTDGDPLPEALEIIENADERILVIDPMRKFEQEEMGAYRSFLKQLADWADRTGSVVFLHGLDGRGVADRRDMTEYLADAVFKLTTDISRERVINSLAVPKFRGGHAVDHVIKLDLTGDVDVDISRKIA